MEKFKEKLNTLRTEAETANKRAAELEEKCNALETDHAQKDEQLNNLVARAKELEEALEAAEVNLKQATADFREADLRAEQLGKKAVKIEQEIAIWDKKNADLEAKYQAAKAEMEELDGQMEGV
ncbi:Ceramide glucosyltransferase [Mucor velutinosus]|uniref:Ceramide glucosyltransferase n=1 Tax=Mucor velutinosus TaxID=708070 RepID=A0AAN7DL12_9FUNG|nr:Ceramide glucosyltransferase [Mucor velutinosus]